MSLYPSFERNAEFTAQATFNNRNYEYSDEDMERLKQLSMVTTTGSLSNSSDNRDSASKLYACSVNSDLVPKRRKSLSSDNVVLLASLRQLSLDSTHQATSAYTHALQPCRSRPSETGLHSSFSSTMQEEQDDLSPCYEQATSEKDDASKFGYGDAVPTKNHDQCPFSRRQANSLLNNWRQNARRRMYQRRNSFVIRRGKKKLSMAQGLMIFPDLMVRTSSPATDTMNHESSPNAPGLLRPSLAEATTGNAFLPCNRQKEQIMWPSLASSRELLERNSGSQQSGLDMEMMNASTSSLCISDDWLPQASARTHQESAETMNLSAASTSTNGDWSIQDAE